MQTQQIIRASADVLTITRLSPGDCYKRVEEDTTYARAALRFGVVQDVMNNGEDSAVTALEYEADYSAGAKALLKVFTGSKPAAIFPATPGEVTAHLDGLLESARRAVGEAESALATRRAALVAVEAMASNLGSLTTPESSTAVLDAVEVDDGE